MRQDQLSPSPGSKHARKRVGRGDASGHGSYSGKGCKGQKARSGGGPRPGFEGGQLPIIKRLPEKRGFVNIFRQEYRIVNVGSLSVFPPESEVTPEALFTAGLVDSPRYPVKVLGDGEIDRALVVKAHRFSGTAQEKIVAAGGKTEKL
ncbi:MAG: 50S ribosomal protein L15 [Chloroflexi bacterium]|nr:50S ribosomal protein L15 [Chloroflexota bacterium]